MRYRLLLSVFLLFGAVFGAAQQPPAPAAASEAQLAHPGKPAVPFIENNYAEARAQAQQRNVPLFVDMWAPW